MLNVRTFIHLLVGLTLLLQGFAVSAATLSLPQDSAPMEMASMEGMHCHMDADSASDTAGTQQNCCDHSCPDMASCFASVATVMPMSLLVVSPMTVEPTSHPQGQVPGGTIASLLRPPISFHS